jgi:hypothetical protein
MKHDEELKQIGPRVSETVANALADYSKLTRMPQALIVEAALRDLLKDAGYDV